MRRVESHPQGDRQQLKWVAAQNGASLALGMQTMHERAIRTITNGDGSQHDAFTNHTVENVTQMQVAELPIASSITTEAFPSQDEQKEKKLTRPSIRFSDLDPTNLNDVLNGPFFRRYAGDTWANYLAASQDKTRIDDKLTVLQQRSLGENPTDQEIVDFRKTKQTQQRKDRERATEYVSRRALDTLREDYTLPTDEAAQNFFDHHYRVAIDTYHHLIDTISPNLQYLDLRNEAAFKPESFGDFVKTIADPSTDPILKKQLAQLLMITHISMERAFNEKEVKPAKHLSRIQQLLNLRLYQTGSGYAENMTIRAAFENDTNKTRYVEGINNVVLPTPPENMHIKEFRSLVRTSKELGIQLITSPNEKTDEAFLIKALRKAQSRAEKGLDDTIDVNEVRDTHRMMFAVHGSINEVQLLSIQIEDILKDPKSQVILCNKDLAGRPLDIDGNPVDIDVDEVIENINNPDYTIDESLVSRLSGRLLKVEDDSSTNGTKDQSNNVNFLRTQATFEGLDKPIELMAHDFFSYQDYMYHIGEWDPTRQRFSGAAHTIYEVDRAVKVGQTILNGTGKDIRGEATKTQRARAKLAREAKRGRSRRG